MNVYTNTLSQEKQLIPHSQKQPYTKHINVLPRVFESLQNSTQKLSFSCMPGYLKFLPLKSVKVKGSLPSPKDVKRYITKSHTHHVQFNFLQVFFTVTQKRSIVKGNVRAKQIIPGRNRYKVMKRSQSLEQGLWEYHCRKPRIQSILGAGKRRWLLFYLLPSIFSLIAMKYSLKNTM